LGQELSRLRERRLLYMLGYRRYERKMSNKRNKRSTKTLLLSHALSIGKVFDTDKFVWLQAREVYMLSKLYVEFKDQRPDDAKEWLKLAKLGE